LFNLLSERHERTSTIVTTNLAFSEWVQVLGDEKLTTALLDRLAYRAHILTTMYGMYGNTVLMGETTRFNVLGDLLYLPGGNSFCDRA